MTTKNQKKHEVHDQVDKKLTLPSDYADWLVRLKARIHGARQKIVLSANREQIRLYHEIGCDILARQNKQA